VKWLIAITLFLSIHSACKAQGLMATVPESLRPPSWVQDPALFLEPNNFTIEKEMLDRSLWLRVGYGAKLYPIGNGAIGMEALAWSRLEMLSQFRFPVQTVDYFFGIFDEWRDSYANWRVRISHISSHFVDGADSITGGSSSKYSREFVEVMREVPQYIGPFGDMRGLSWALGLRLYFHQVTKIEPWVAVPATLTWRFADMAGAYPRDYNPQYPVMEPLSLFISSGDGPVWPSIAGGLRYERMQPSFGVFGLEFYYYYGASWAGVDAGAKVSQLKLQMDVRDF